jgi:Zn-dependent protease
MGTSWKIGRVAGIDLFVHPTFLLVLFFPGVLSGGATSLLIVLSLFGCVLLHELGHALMARRFGIETVNITLYPIGGIARLQRIPRAPGAELLITLAGPAVNFVLAFLFAMLGALDGVTGAGSSLGLFFEQLMVVNLVLGVFNLVPAFPMDGGRILRALLSGWLGRVQATIVAARFGRTLAVLFGIYSLVSLNLFQVALAAFIYFAASSEEAQVLFEERRRRYSGGNEPQGQGIWVAPAGHHWVDQGDGIWRLAPIVVRGPDLRRDATSWR